MKKFLIRISYFSIIPIFLLLIQNFIPSDDILDESLERKITLLPIDTNRINVIIAGDSRAERQLSSKIIKEKTGLNVINIATSACDLVTVVTAIKKKFPTNQKSIFVISASSWQINDGSIAENYLSLKSFKDLSFLEKLSLYNENVAELIRLQILLVKPHWLLQRADLTYSDSITLNNIGFQGVNGYLNKDLEIKNTIKSHCFYSNLKNNGIRWALFQRSLAEMGNMNSSFIIYSPPISNYWRINTKDTFIDIAEREYSKKIKAEVLKYKNIVLLDFYSNPIDQLNDSMYYDIQHLNINGAKVFSEILSKKIKDVNN